MKRDKKSTLKGFTLIELIVVVAVFGLLIAATLSFVTPTRKVYKNASEYAGASAMVDNVRRVVEDNLRFANRMDIYAGPDLSGYASEEAFVNKKVELFRTKFMLGDSDRVTFARDRVYVMKIDNPEETQISAGFAAGSQKPGRVSIWQYDGGTRNTANSKEWAIAEGVYNEYSFSLSYGIDFDTHPITIAGTQWDIIDSVTYTGFDANFVDPSNFTLMLDIYKNSYDDRSNPAASSYRLARTAVSNVVALSFVNMVDSGNALEDRIKIKNPTAGEPDLNKNCGKRYYYEGATKTRDLYFVYTVPDLT